MTTKPPSAVKEYPAESLEKIAYGSVAGIPTQEPNDRNRLGFHVWQWLQNREGELSNVVRVSGARIHISHEEAVRIITETLDKQGIKL